MKQAISPTDGARIVFCKSATDGGKIVFQEYSLTIVIYTYFWKKYLVLGIFVKKSLFYHLLFRLVLGIL